MKLQVTPQARRHLESIAEYLRERSPRASQRVGRRIRETIALLCDFPLIGHRGALDGTREMIVRGLPYVIVYRIEAADQQTLVILGIYHGAQLRPGQARRR